jgi:Fe-S-cluster containining protein
MNYEAFQQRASGKKEQFRKTLRQLCKMKDNQVDQLFHEAHEEAFQEIDCLECAGCCTHVGPRWTRQDIKRVSKLMKMKEADFEAAYLKIDEDDDYVFQSMPCPFLQKDNHCMIYEKRPKACREYPHTDRNKMKQLLGLTIKNSSCCPAVEKMLDGISEVVKGRI